MNDLKKKYEELKEMNKDIVIDSLIKETIEISKRWKKIEDSMSDELLKCVGLERSNETYEDINNYRPSDEEIEEILNKEFGIENKSNCSTYYKEYGIDLEDICGDLREKDIEISRILAFCDNKYLGYVEGTSHSSVGIRNIDHDKLMNSVRKKYPTCNGIIDVHNHPYVANAILSELDHNGMKKNIDILRKKGIKVLDYCVFSKYDFDSNKKNNN